jgi:hypothetical protein
MDTSAPFILSSGHFQNIVSVHSKIEAPDEQHIISFGNKQFRTT